MTATRKNNPDSTSPASGIEIYEKVQKLTTQSFDQLLKSFFSQLSKTRFQHLSGKDSDRLIAQVQRKQDIIHSSFLFQIKNNFADFKASRQFRSQQNTSANDQVLGLVGTNHYTELEELDSIVSRFQQKYSQYYISIADQLGLSINRQEVDALDNPLHARHLCLSFQSAIGTLNLVIAQKVALYKVFANLVIEQMEPLYIDLQECLINQQPNANLNPMPIEKTNPEDEKNTTEQGKSVAMSHIPVLIGIFQSFKDRSNTQDCVFSNLLPELKANLGQKGINEFDSLIDKLTALFDIIFSDEDLPQQIKQQLARLQIFIFMSEIQHGGFAVRSSHPARRLIDTIIRTEVDFDKNNRADRSGCEVIRTEIDKISSNPFLETDYYSRLCELYIEHTSEACTAESLKDMSSDIDNAARNQTAKPESESLRTQQDQQEAENYIAATETGTVDIILETEKPAERTSKADNIYAVVQSIVNDIALPLKMQGRSLILFDEVWFPLLLKVARKQGFQSQAWQKIVTIAKTQTWVLTPKNNQSDLDKLRSTLSHIEKSLTQSMQSLSMPADQQASLLEFLQYEQEDVIRQTREQIKVKSQAEKPRVEKPSSKPEAQSNSRSRKDHLADTIDEFSNLMETERFNKSQDMLEALQFDNKIVPAKDKPSIDGANIHKGDWVEIKKSHNVVLAKLTWKDEKSSQYIFVDREGHRVCEISREDLDRELTEGSISLISSSPVRSQRPAFSIIQSLE